MTVAIVASHTVGYKKVELVETAGRKYVVYHYGFDGLIWVQTNLCDTKNPAGYLDRLSAQHVYARAKQNIEAGRPALMGT